MVVCKFFQQGHCRFGQSCKFEHVYGSKYSYHANQPQQQPVQSNVTDEQLANQVVGEVQQILNSGWVLSSYAPFNDKQAFPGLVDLSPEEARLFIYEAKASNTLDQAMAYIKNLTEDARNKYRQIAQPSPKIIKVLRSLFKGEVTQSPFNDQPNSFGNTTTPASSIFRSAVQSKPEFGNSNSIFGQQNTFASQTTPQSIFSQATQNVFGGQATFPAQTNPGSIFASASQSVFGVTNNQAPFVSNQGNVFQKQEASPFSQNAQNQNSGNVFAQTNNFFGQAAASAFNQQPANNAANSVFNQNPTNNVFAQNPAQTSVFAQNPSSTSVFGQNPTASVFGQNTSSQPLQDSGIYSKMEELSPEDVEIYKSDDFKLGFIPDLPPAQELCR